MRRFLDQKLNWDIARVEKRLRADYDRGDLFEIKVDEFWGFDSCMMGASDGEQMLWRKSVQELSEGLWKRS